MERTYIYERTFILRSWCKMLRISTHLRWVWYVRSTYHPLTSAPIMSNCRHDYRTLDGPDEVSLILRSAVLTCLCSLMNRECRSTDIWNSLRRVRYMSTDPLSLDPSSAGVMLKVYKCLGMIGVPAVVPHMEAGKSTISLAWCDNHTLRRSMSSGSAFTCSTRSRQWIVNNFEAIQ